ncbi:MAG: zinc-ribbon domain-containing protein [Catonella sp.]|uniref:zinc ribbon domain-containing protein n=1 Tax=Catonella sp. TaxID=2382125 RepID=UPI003FA16BFA
MFCNKCGNELITGAKFCGKCGQKVEEEGSSTLSGVESTGNLQKMSKVTEGKDSIISVLLSRIKQRKYFVLGGLGIVLFMVVLIPLFNQKGKVGDSEPSKIETASLIATSSLIISSETDLDLSGSSLSSANDSETSDAASAELEDTEDEDTYDSDISSSLSDEGEAEDSGARLIGSDEGISYEDEEEEIVEEPVETYQKS